MGWALQPSETFRLREQSYVLEGCYSIGPRVDGARSVTRMVTQQRRDPYVGSTASLSIIYSNSSTAQESFASRIVIF